MIPYLIILFFSVLPITVQHSNKQLARYLSVLLCVILSLFSGLRYQVGVDYYNYNEFFLTIFQGYDVYFEKGFHLLVELIGAVWPEPRLIFFIMSILTCAFLFLSIIKYSKSYSLSLFVFVSSPFLYMASFNQIRQFFVCAVFFYFLEYITDKRKLFLILLVVFLSFFHKSAVLYIPLILLGERRFNYFVYVFIIALLVFVAKYVDVIVNFIGLSSAYIIESASFGIDPRFYIFLLIFTFHYYLLYKDNVDNRKSINNIFLNLIFSCVCVLFLPGFITIIDPSEIVRLLGLFSMSLCFVVPYFVSKIPRDNILREFSILGVVVIFSAYFILTLLLNGERYNLVPYSMW